ncbi:hypothetical protein B1no1_15680 [Thermolongibacillus altinsuensis]|nr:hypothetical protein B1no1_15680 [Thermolongibacillus altinsuensis]
MTSGLLFLYGELYGEVVQVERIGVVDAIRGFALLGILLVNIFDFSAPVLYVEPEHFAKGMLDRWAVMFVDLFAQASFYPLFSTLFGWGAFIMLERAKRKGQPFQRIFSRRLAALFLFGCIHAFFIWHGDILMSYAMVGLFLFLFVRTSAAWLLRWSLLLFFVPNGILIVLLFLAWASEGDVDLSEPALAEEAIRHYRDGTWMEVLIQRWHDWLYMNNAWTLVFFLVAILPLFLFGAYIAKQQWFQRLDEHRLTIQKWCLFSFLFALIFKSLPYWTEKNVVTQYIQDMIGGPALSIFYLTAFSLFLRKRSSWLAPVGKMALTNYLLQSIICTTLFYSYGFGLYGNVRPFVALLIAIIIYVVQVIYSHWWMRSFEIGPIEWIWRAITYGEKPRLRREKTT